MSIEILFEAEDDNKPKTADVTSEDIGDDGFGGDVGDGLKDEDLGGDEDVDESEADKKDGEEDTKDTPDVPADDNNDDGLDGDGDGLDDDDLGSDPSADDISSDDTSTDDTTTEETPTEDQSGPDKVKQNLLLKTTINLYNNIKMNVSKIDGIRCDTIIVNKIVIQVKKNLLKLLDVIYDYTTSKFRNLKYVENLYMYNYFLESYKINIEMLKKIGNFSGND